LNATKNRVPWSWSPLVKCNSPWICLTNAAMIFIPNPCVAVGSNASGKPGPSSETERARNLELGSLNAEGSLLKFIGRHISKIVAQLLKKLLELDIFEFVQRVEMPMNAPKRRDTVHPPNDQNENPFGAGFVCV
jgi:hypothetical protein